METTAEVLGSSGNCPWQAVGSVAVSYCPWVYLCLPWFEILSPPCVSLWGLSQGLLDTLWLMASTLSRTGIYPWNANTCFKIGLKLARNVNILLQKDQNISFVFRAAEDTLSSRLVLVPPALSVDQFLRQVKHKSFASGKANCVQTAAAVLKPWKHPVRVTDSASWLLSASSVENADWPCPPIQLRSAPPSSATTYRSLWRKSLFNVVSGQLTKAAAHDYMWKCLLFSVQACPVCK